jgi:hypothetical protein
MPKFGSSRNDLEGAAWTLVPLKSQQEKNGSLSTLPSHPPHVRYLKFYFHHLINNHPYLVGLRAAVALAKPPGKRNECGKSKLYGE